MYSSPINWKSLTETELHTLCTGDEIVIDAVSPLTMVQFHLDETIELILSPLAICSHQQISLQINMSNFKN